MLNSRESLECAMTRASKRWLAATGPVRCTAKVLFFQLLLEDHEWFHGVWNHQSHLRFVKCSKCPTANARLPQVSRKRPAGAGIPEGGNLGMMGVSRKNHRVVSVWPFPAWLAKCRGEVPLWYEKTPMISYDFEFAGEKLWMNSLVQLSVLHFCFQ